MRMSAFVAVVSLAWGGSGKTPAVVAPARLGTYIAGGLGVYAPLELWKNDIQRARELKIGIVRFNSDAWDFLEPERGRYQWAALDAAVREAHAAGLDILFTLPISSRWNGEGKPITVHGMEVGPSHFPTKDLPSLRALAKALASRYRKEIRYIEVWNEPDFFLFWKGKPDAKEYLELLREAYAGLKEGNPGVTVLIGGLAKPKEEAWLDEFLRAGGGRYFEVMNLHVYPAFASLDEALGMARSVMSRHGARKPIWITETSSTGFFFDTPDRDKEERRKSIHLARSYAAAFSQPDVERVFWHSLRNPGRDVGLDRDLDFGLMAGDGTPLPAHRAHQAFSRLIVGSVPEGKVQVGEGVEAYRFRRGDGAVDVVWSRSGARGYKPPPGRAVSRVFTLLGEERPLPQGGTVTVSEEPLYLELGGRSGPKKRGRS